MTVTNKRVNSIGNKRACKAEHLKNSARIGVALTPKEAAEWKRLAAANGESLNNFVRRRCNG